MNTSRRAAAAAPGAPMRNRDVRRSLIDGVEGGPSKPCEAPVQATLVLKDGQRLEGTSFGAKVNRPGEVVFNTGMVRARRPFVFLRHRCDSFPSHDDVGGFFFDFEPFRTASQCVTTYQRRSATPRP